MPAVAPNGDVYVAFSDFSAGGISVVKSTEANGATCPAVSASLLPCVYWPLTYFEKLLTCCELHLLHSPLSLDAARQRCCS